MRQRLRAWDDQWNPEDLLRRSGLACIIDKDTVRAVGADPMGGPHDIVIIADQTIAEPGARERDERNIPVPNGVIKLATLLADLQDVFATTGNVHWGDATDARLLSDALNVGFFMFTNRLQNNGRCCLYSMDQLRGDFPFFINL